MSEIKVGELITGIAERDAIHVPVAPVVAGEDLKPGDHVGFEGDGTVVSYRQSNQHVGIIDPFLKEDIKKGNKCWLFLYPKTVFNLRHNWDHPKFMDPEVMGKSVSWLTEYASSHGMTYDDMMVAVGKYVDSGCDEFNDLLENHFKDYETPPEFWSHYYAVTGRNGSGDFWGCCV